MPGSFLFALFFLTCPELPVFVLSQEPLSRSSEEAASA
jgi:hypothetical protein